MKKPGILGMPSGKTKYMCGCKRGHQEWIRGIPSNTRLSLEGSPILARWCRATDLLESRALARLDRTAAENGLLHNCQIQLPSNFDQPARVLQYTKCHPLFPPVVPRHSSFPISEPNEARATSRTLSPFAHTWILFSQWCHLPFPLLIPTNTSTGPTHSLRRNSSQTRTFPKSRD
jgi:hypothetical protein